MGGVHSIKYAGAFSWAWAVKNMVLGPLKQDLGVISFALLFISDVFLQTRIPLARVIVSLGLAVQYLGTAFAQPFRACLVPAEKLAKKTGKSVLWAQIFQPYLVVS